MTDRATEISSDTILDDVEHHFRIRAGPGAGKTYWLIGHIKSVLQTSQRLTPASRIGCISYTNVAVNGIRDRLGSAVDAVDVSTIHSFLYRNVVKPYLYLLRNEAGEELVKCADVDGHDEHRPRYDIVSAWIGRLKVDKLRGLFFQADHAKLFRELCRIAWDLVYKGGRWLVRGTRVTTLRNLSSQQIQNYKAMYWKRGDLDHEDVLYFAYRILDEHPLIRNFLSARFPYLFIDEFQDTNPVQTQVVKWLAECGSVVGVIGDAEQSIYAFQGAMRQDFLDFSVPGIRDYNIRNNRRSTDRIIELLNHVRGDGLHQVGHRNVSGEPVRVIVADAAKSVSAVRKSLPEPETLYVLARKNQEVSRLRRQQSSTPTDLWEEFENVDSDRAHFFERLVTATEAARLGNITLALGELLRGMWRRTGNARRPLKCANGTTGLQRRGVAVSLLADLVTDYHRISSSTLFDVHARVANAVQSVRQDLSLTGIRNGKFAGFAKKTCYAELAAAVRLSDETRTVRTMHNAKGGQFDNVLVCLEAGTKTSGLDQLLTSDGSDDEERRVTYVALSRAENRLFISVPLLLDDHEQQLRKLGVEVKRLS